MLQPLISLDYPASSKPADFTLDLGGFSATTATITAVTDAAKAYIGGAVSVNVRKSQVFEFAERAQLEGLKVG